MLKVLTVSGRVGEERVDDHGRNVGEESVGSVELRSVRSVEENGGVVEENEGGAVEEEERREGG